MDEKTYIEVQFSEKPYKPRQIENVKGNTLSFESQVVITTLVAINTALFIFLVFMLG